jgi:hypothetical protein
MKDTKTITVVYELEIQSPMGIEALEKCIQDDIEYLIKSGADHLSGTLIEVTSR